jgi:hypothetical protein
MPGGNPGGMPGGAYPGGKPRGGPPGGNPGGMPGGGGGGMVVPRPTAHELTAAPAAGAAAAAKDSELPACGMRTYGGEAR